MAVKHDWKGKLGSFIGWVVTLAILGTMGFYIYLGVNAYTVGRRVGDKAGHVFLDEYGATKGAVFEKNLRDFVDSRESRMKSDWKGKFYRQGFEDGFNALTGPWPR